MVQQEGTGTIEAKGMAVGVARIADGMRARDIAVLDVSSVLGLTDYFVIATGTSRRQLRAMSEEIIHVLKRQGIHRLFMSGEKDSGWVLIDFGEVVVHLFSADAREHYSLESLWEDAPALEWQSLDTEIDIERPSPEAPPFGSVT